MNQKDFDAVLSALMAKKNNPLLQPKFDIREVERVTTAEKNDKKITLKDIEEVGNNR